MKPLVSISCITYNHERYIRDTLDSMLSQKTDFDFEILIHDDASTDKTADIIKEYQSKYPDIIKPILQSQNQYSIGIINVSGRYNFPRAQGEYIAMCEGDDMWCDDNKLQLQVDYMRGHSECSLCFHSARIITEGGELHKALMRPLKKSQVVSASKLVGSGFRIPTASLFFRTEYVRKQPDYYTNCPIGDIPLQLMLAQKGDAYYIDKPMSMYRFAVAGSWTENMLSGNYIEKQRAYVKAMKAMYKDFDKHSEYRFHKESVRAYKRIRYLSSINCRDWNVIYAPEYARFRRELAPLERVLLSFERHMPKAYNKVRELWLGRKK